MGWTKRQFVQQGFTEIGLPPYVFNIQPGQLFGALTMMDAMIAYWNSRGIRLGWPLPSSPEFSNIDAQTDCPDSANQAVYTNLAVRLGPSYGKVVSEDTKNAAMTGFDFLLSIAGGPIPMQLPAIMPLGAGNKPWSIYQPFVQLPRSPLQAGQDSYLAGLEGFGGNYLNGDGTNIFGETP